MGERIDSIEFRLNNYRNFILYRWFLIDAKMHFVKLWTRILWEPSIKEMTCRISSQRRVNQNKLWHRIDLDGFNAVKSDVVMKRIAGPHRPFSTQESFLN